MEDWKENIETAEGHAIDGDDMHWTVNCPNCDIEIEYKGYFDSSDLNKCKCGCRFTTTKVWIDEKYYIE